MSNMCTEYEDYLIVTIPKELDHHVADMLRQEVDQCFLKRVYPYVIFDFRQTVFMDSAGIGLIMGRYRKVQMIHGKVIVVGLKPAMEKIFTISGLNRVVIKLEKMEDAVHVSE